MTQTIGRNLFKWWFSEIITQTISWILFYQWLKKLAKVIQNKKNLKIASIKSDHGGEFENKDFELFCDENGIEHNFSTPTTPQQNGVVERKNWSIEEMARTLLNDTNLPKYFWAEFYWGTLVSLH